MKRNVLLIDDESINNMISRFILEKTNLVGSIESVGNGHEAIHFLEALIVNKKLLPDLLLLDINMPYMDGFEFLKELRDHLSIDHNSLHIVMLSSSLDPRDKKKAETFGVTHFLEKPLSLSQAIMVLQEQELRTG